MSTMPLRSSTSPIHPNPGGGDPTTPPPKTESRLTAASVMQWVAVNGLADHIARIVDAAPPLNSDQRAHLASVLAATSTLQATS